MRKTLWLLVAALTWTMGAVAQAPEQDEPVIVYYSPKNYVVLDFTYAIEQYEKGPFAQYAGELLGIEDAIQENRTEYRLNDVHVGTRTEADLNRAHKVSAETGVALQLLSINEKGVLAGYNLPIQETQKPSKHAARENEKPIVSSARAIPYTEEILESKSIASQAEAVAKHIFRLRETKLYLLSGETEHAPADGAAMKRVLDELDKQESELVRLFAGTQTITVRHKRVEYLPMGEQGRQLHKQLYFSAENGFTSADNIDADSIEITIQFQRQQLSIPQTDPKAKKKGVPTASQIVYNLPGHGDVRVRYKGVLMSKRTLPLAQFGVDVPLARDLFTGKELPVIRFNEKTGNIVSISK